MTPQELRDLLDYDPCTGIWTWRVSRGAAKRGFRAGLKNKAGYRYITVKRKGRFASHLAFYYMTGKWPVEIVDHKDGNRSNDSWDNLRQANHRQNSQNAKTKRNSVCGLKGVYEVKGTSRQKPWMARIRVDGKRKTLGYFGTPEEAHAAYYNAAFVHFGEFARAA